MLYLHHDLKPYFSASADLFDQIMSLRGECFRDEKGRLTQRITLGGNAYFIKQHTGVGWKEILKNIFQFRWPVISAKNEWCAIEKLKALNVAAPALMGYGSRGRHPAYIQSFVLMEALNNTISLEDVCATWRTHPPSFAFKQALLKEVARIASTLHDNGMNHRDFYICHFLLDLQQTKLYLIDLHRAQIRKYLPERWRIKDLAGLYFSSKNTGLTQRDYFRFMQAYRQQPLKTILKNEKNFWKKVKQRGEALYRDHE